MTAIRIPNIPVPIPEPFRRGDGDDDNRDDEEPFYYQCHPVVMP